MNRLQDHPWCAAAATLINATASQRWLVNPANITGKTATAHASMAVFRAALTLQPRLRSDDESQPPATLPTSATR